MNKRYRLKLIVNGLGGTLGYILRLFPNALTFVGSLTPDELTFVASVSSVLNAFGVGLEVAEA